MKYLLFVILLVLVLAESKSHLRSQKSKDKSFRPPPKRKFPSPSKYSTEQVEIDGKKKSKISQAPPSISTEQVQVSEKKAKKQKSSDKISQKVAKSIGPNVYMKLKTKMETSIVDSEDILFLLDNPEALKMVSDYVFDMFDKNGNGEIDVQEFYILLVYAAGTIDAYPPDEQIAQEWLDGLDLDDSQHLSKDEFLVAFKIYLQVQYQVQNQ